MCGTRKLLLVLDGAEALLQQVEPLGAKPPPGLLPLVLLGHIVRSRGFFDS